uniref:Candidate secreted effector n=1 Tax=Meloidogyne incognita TaxID=6306 RepID=A0A914L0T2_MELIC
MNAKGKSTSNTKYCEGNNTSNKIWKKSASIFIQTILDFKKYYVNRLMFKNLNRLIMSKRNIN